MNLKDEIIFTENPSEACFFLPNIDTSFNFNVFVIWFPLLPTHEYLDQTEFFSFKKSETR